MDSFSHLSGAMWEEFKSSNYSSQAIEDHTEFLSELSALYEVCKEHFNFYFLLPKTE